MLYGFTATKAGTDEIPISKIRSTDYRKVWDKFNNFNVNIIYKFMHHGNNHIHYHGLILADRLNYKELMIDGYSIKFEKNVNYERWHNYCMHEIKDQLEEANALKTKTTEIKIYKRCMNTGAQSRNVKPNILLHLKIFGKI